MAFSDRILKGRIAETIVSEMFQEAGYYVYRFGYEGILQSLIQKGLPRMKEGDLEADKVRSMPDFIVMDKDGDVSFIEVKYRTSRIMDSSLNRWLSKAEKYWPETRLILAHPTPPHFMISRVKDFARNGKLYWLEQDKFIHIDKNIVARYTELVRQYFDPHKKYALYKTNTGDFL